MLGLLWWLVMLPVRVILGLVAFGVVLVLGLIGQGGRDDAEADAGRWKTIGPWRHDRHLVPPAIGRKGWTKG